MKGSIMKIMKKMDVWGILQTLDEIVKQVKDPYDFKSRRGFVVRLVYDVDECNHFDYRARIFLVVKDGEFRLRLLKLNSNLIGEEPLDWFLPTDFAEVNYEQFFETVIGFLADFSSHCKKAA